METVIGSKSREIDLEQGVQMLKKEMASTIIMLVSMSPCLGKDRLSMTRTRRKD